MSFRVCALLIVVSTLVGAANGADNIPYLPPPGAQSDALPRSMIVMSRDHNLFFKAYTDWSDLDRDGVIDSTYKSSVEYYGYFESDSCYQYDGGLDGGAFKRVSEASNYTCSGAWSGNLLNWATMTRMDIVRKVLYGGKRYRDNSSDSTILERAFLPMDSHSFAKVISDPRVIGSSTPLKGSSAITFCNTTFASTGMSGSVSAPPLIRIARSSQSDETGWPNWAATEVRQCQWRESGGALSGNRPQKGSDGSTEFRARVEVCRGQDRVGECERYPDSASAKPIGLLQNYGRNIEFGLLTGSYANNLTGGVLRSNLADFSREYDAGSGVFKDLSGADDVGIVRNLNAIRIARYDYASGGYGGSDGCPWWLSSYQNGICTNWGNPFAEMTLEALRYLSGERHPTSDYVNGEAAFNRNHVPGLSVADWKNDIEEKWCAPHSLLMINTSDISFDGDDLKGSGSPVSNAEATQYANQIGQIEDIQGRYFIGNNGSTENDQLCTAKAIANLGGASGLCPAGPALKGTYKVAGLAKFAHTEPFIESLAGQQGPVVDTYGVQLSSNIPVVQAGNASIVPACENLNTGGRCAIVNFRTVSQSDDASSGVFDVVWDDAAFGNDFDLDAAMRLRYTVRDGRLRVTTKVTRAAASVRLGLGYILSGTNADGFHAHSGINGYNGPECANCQAGDAESTHEYDIVGGSGKTLERPLFYAAKYGNDGRNSDGSPSAYFEVNRIGDLGASLQTLLNQVLDDTNRAGAGGVLGFGDAINGWVFRTRYNNAYSWAGDVEALTLNDDGKTTTEWRARDALPSPQNRNLITWDLRHQRGMPFTRAAIVEAYGAGLDRYGDLIDYLRGNSAREQRNGGNYRDRLWADGSSTAKLGDFIGSTPYLVGIPNTYYVPGANDTSYADFRIRHRDRTPVLYVGGNDGMLHAFNATNGRELMGYVPGIVQLQLPELADPQYEHRYYVDGSPTVLDARHGDEGQGAWFSLLASGLGSGGRGVFALDVTDPLKFSESRADSIALWEYGISADEKLFGKDQQLGYVRTQPSIVRLENGRYAVVFGNGTDSAADKASLYMVYVDGPEASGWKASDVIRLTPADADNAANGMTTVSLVDRDSNGRVDLAYAADLQGSVWRFDLSGDADQWQSRIHRLFKATRNNQRQVINSPLEVGRDPAGGLMIFFGTGSRGTDGTSTSQSRGAGDSFYAIRDWKNDEMLEKTTMTRASLNARVLRSSSAEDTVRTIEKVDTSAFPDHGWLIDFPDSERVVDGPLIRGNRILFSSLIPGLGVCGAEDAGFLYELNAWYGSAFSTPVLDVNDDNKIDDGDRYEDESDGMQTYVPVGMKTDGALFTPLVVVSEDGKHEKKVGLSTKGGVQPIDELPLNNLRLGRVTWRVLE